MSFIKWVGGKNQIINEIINFFPENIETYYEPFLGGGSVLIAILKLCEEGKIKIKNFKCSDINENLIGVYLDIKNNKNNLILNLKNLYVEFSNSKDKKEFYYEIRKKYNELKNNFISGNSLISENSLISGNSLISSYFIFLNKVGFRGLYRENSKGEFNVPYGNYKNPNFINEDLIENLSLLFNKFNVEFSVVDFKTINKNSFLNKNSKNDFFYFDPPYYPVNEKSFTKYSNGDFKLEDHKNLVEVIKKLNCKFLLSNSDTNWITENFKKFNIKKIKCKRRINSKNPNSTCNEVLIF